MFLIKNIFVSPHAQSTGQHTQNTGQHTQSTDQHTALTFTNYEGLLNDPLEIPVNNYERCLRNYYFLSFVHLDCFM